MHFGRNMTKQKKYNECTKSAICKECPSNDMCQAWVNFVEKHSDTKPYVHFDKRVSLRMPSIRRYVLSSRNITTHSFYPFIHFQKKNSRFGKKGPKKPRELYYCSHLDRCVYQRYAFLINYYYNIWAKENGIDNIAIAYRDNLAKNNIDFAKAAFDAIKDFQKCFIFVGDFTNFFDNLNHQYLKRMICKVLNMERLPDDYYAVLKNITRFASWDWKDLVKAADENILERGIRTKLNQKPTILTKKQFQDGKKFIKKNCSDVGVPQGSPISAVLSNVYMIEFDSALNDFVSNNHGIYLRYSDDFIIILPYEDNEKIDIFRNSITSFIDSKNNLVDLQKEKTSCYVYNESNLFHYPTWKASSINYLGFLFDGKNIKIRPRAITKYYYRMRRKARTIGLSKGISSKGKRISAKNLYSIYSKGGDKQTFIDYAAKAKRELHLIDPEAEALIKRHKEKIALAIKRPRKRKGAKNT